MNDWKAKLKALGPCPEAYRWAVKHKTLREAWRKCERGDWMDWLLYRCGVVTLVDPQVFGTSYMPWEDPESGLEEVELQDAYIILDFMPDPPKLPEIAKE